MNQKNLMRILVENTPKGWNRLYLQGKGANNIDVRTHIYGKLDDRQLFSLRYCFTALDQLESLNQAPVALNLHIVTENLDDAYRIQHYLAVMTVFRDVVLEITCGNEKINGTHRLTNDYYRIMPLLCVSAARLPWEIHYLDMAGLGDASKTRALVSASFQAKSPITSIGRGGSALELLDQTIMNNLWNLQRNISGDSDADMKDADKGKLRKELQRIIGEEMPCLCLLAQMLWSLFLRSLSDSKDLFYRGTDRQWQVNKETLRCTRLDAASYAEGILQLMENACIHSDMRRSYFSLRLRDVDITGSGVIRVAEAAKTRADIYEQRAQLWKQIPDLSEGSKQGKPIPRYQLDRQAKFCLEFSVFNDSTSSDGLAGISRMFAKNRERDPQKMCLPDVFSYQCDRLSDISKHYGLRLLEKTVHLNGGFLSVRSPGTQNYQERYGSYFNTPFKPLYYQAPSQDDPCTDFDVLLPLYPHWHSVPEPSEGSSPPSSLFQQEYLKHTECRQTILRFLAEPLARGARDPIFQPMKWLQEPGITSQLTWDLTTRGNVGWSGRKDAMIDHIWEELKGAVSGHTEEDLYLLDLMQVWDTLSLELLAKAVFLLVAWNKSEKKDGLKLALLLPNEMFISEFIRIFSIFYDKQLSDASWMGNTQIALCGYPDDGDRLPQVLFLLAGNTSGSARVTARTFAYYNTGTVLDLMPQIQYLTRTESAVSVPQFPFDLVLTAVPESQAGTGELSWFLRQMRLALNADLWKRPHGCRIHGIRVRLHSNIYLSDFYEAELLFHNVGIIYRFSYLIARDLLSQFVGQPPEHLVVVGYELYSSVLIEQIARLLSAYTDVNYLIYSAEQQGEPLHLSPRLKTMDDAPREHILTNSKYAAVIPIGTTMSTLYHIMYEISAKWNGSFPYENYVLILVGQKGEATISLKYWTKVQERPGYIRLQPQRSGDDERLCRYYLEPLTDWFQESANWGTNENVLVYVDKTSTRPKEIFVVKDSHFKGSSYFLRTDWDRQENTRRLELLKGLIHYGHIVSGKNHFQFYLDLDRYLSRAQQDDPNGKRKTVDQWLCGLRARIDPNAYNIIVSPLHQEDSPFAKAVIDHVFEHSLRFLHIDPDDSFREDVRAKFSYISDEYRKIRQFDRNKPVNIYFVNTAITSGNTLARSRNLVTMLMEESGMEYDRENIFKGCFVLVNRSAFDTVNSYVHDPGKYFFAYLHLAVPSFNSNLDRCPTCELLDQYRALEYSCAGNLLGQEFRRLRVKHAKRTIEEHQRWLKETVISNGGYAGWLRQWLFSYIRKRRQKDGKLWAGIFEIDEASYGDLKALYDLLQWGMEKHLERMGSSTPDLSAQGETYPRAINAFSLNHLMDIVNSNKEKAEEIVGEDHQQCLDPDYWITVLTNYVCAQKNYLRLVSTHNTFLEMDTIVGSLEDGIPRRGEQTAALLAKFMEDKLKKVNTYQMKAEWLISYLKTISRPHLAQYHHIRQGILTLMLHMTAYAIGASDELRSDLSFAKPFLRSSSGKELICCQVLQTLLKRLAGLQSTYFLHDDELERVMSTFAKLQADFLSQSTAVGREYQLFNPLPSQEQIERSLIKLVKWTSSCGDDENGCQLIESNFLRKGRE